MCRQSAFCPARGWSISIGVCESRSSCTRNSQAKEVSERALADSCTDCRRALSLFCVIMGRFGGNMALNLGTFGVECTSRAVIVPRFLEFFKSSGFRAAFEDKGRFRDYVATIPVYMISPRSTRIIRRWRAPAPNAGPHYLMPAVALPGGKGCVHSAIPLQTHEQPEGFDLAN